MMSGSPGLNSGGPTPSWTPVEVPKSQATHLGNGFSLPTLFPHNSSLQNRHMALSDHATSAGGT